MTERPVPESRSTETLVSTAEIAETTPLLATSEPELYHTCSTSSQQQHANPNRDEQPPPSKDEKSRSVFGVISVLLIGVFVSQADVTLVMATFAQIASEFDALESGTWLQSAYLLATCVTQPMYGKLSDIFGRKNVLQLSYVIFAIGTVGSGLARDMTQMIAGRVIQGAGGAGMVSMVSILLTDLVPLQEVALYRSYVNIFSTVGRSCGSLVGGYVAQAFGWRWAFLVQFPLLLISIGLVWWRLEEPEREDPLRDQGTLAKWKRIDFVGALFMIVSILPSMLVLDLGGRKISWDNPWIIALLVTSFVGTLLFCLTEAYWAKEPIFPLRLLTHYVVVTSYLQFAIQVGIQMALMYLIPLYFQATENASSGEAGAHLVPSIVGNTIGGLAVGAWIKKTGRYKIPIVLASISAMLCWTLLIILWHGHTSAVESLVVFFGGMGTGMASSAIFVGLTAGVERENTAIAASGLYMSANVGGVAGVSAAGAIFQASLRSRLDAELSRESDGSEIVRKVLSDVGFLRHLHGRIHDVVVGAFVWSIQQTFQVALVFSGVALFLAVVSRQTKITK